MTWISDNAVSRLRAIAEEPDFRGTRYTLVRELARGGMGVVYEAEDAELQRRVAIKVVATELASPDDAERMRREARVIAKLEHPGIVPLHDVGALPDGRIYYAMKLVRGHRLDERPLPRTESLRLFLRLCEAVAFAHANGVVHCDLKPSNVMVGAFGEVLVMDWGVARGIDEPSPQLVVGTRGFIAPEQERGEAVDARSDVYALGAILNELPFGSAEPLTRASRTLSRRERDSDAAAASSLSLRERVAEGRVRGVPKPLRALIAKCVSPDPNDRFSDAAQLAAEVARFLDGEPLLTYRETLIERAGRWLGQNRALVAVIIAYVVMRLIVLFAVRR